MPYLSGFLKNPTATLKNPPDELKLSKSPKNASFFYYFFYLVQNLSLKYFILIIFTKKFLKNMSDFIHTSRFLMKIYMKIFLQ